MMNYMSYCYIYHAVVAAFKNIKIIKYISYYLYKLSIHF